MKREHEQNQNHHHHQEPSPPEVCNECRKAATSEERWLLHTVRHKTSFRRLCTHCVLNCFRGSFCPICLDVFDPIDTPPQPNQRVMCLNNCHSISHLNCTTATSNSGSHPFQCPPCSNPNFSFFKLNQISSYKKLKLEGGTSDGAAVNQHSSTNKGDLMDYSRLAIDKDSAKALVAAAKIASATLTKAAQTARNVADRRVEEAVTARKRAKEALERVAFLSLKEKERDFKAGAPNGLGIVQEQIMKPRITSALTQNECFGVVVGTSTSNAQQEKKGSSSNGVSKQPEKKGSSSNGVSKIPP